MKRLVATASGLKQDELERTRNNLASALQHVPNKYFGQHKEFQNEMTQVHTHMKKGSQHFQPEIQEAQRHQLQWENEHAEQQSTSYGAKKPEEGFNIISPPKHDRILGRTVVQEQKRGMFALVMNTFPLSQFLCESTNV